MQRYFIKNEQLTNEVVEITGDDAAHITKVMRMQAGDGVICVNEDGKAVLVQLSQFDPSSVKGTVLNEMDNETELPIRVTVAQGLPKGDKLETIVQKGTELGAYAFAPFSASRSIVKWDEKKGAKKTERLQKIAKEAAEQAHRLFVPNVAKPVPLKVVAEALTHYDVCIVCDEEEAKQGEKANLKRAFAMLKPGMSLLVIVGPEGGLTREEVALLSAKGAVSCSIGPRIVRTETAAMYVLAALSYQFEL
ncbi:16S rRNA (uracil(1498)-N(3))-methyltransferase [Shouchella rhizosphaerae]|uniref:Ribosomal RNA small subunit methyltransferase E n=1 Tax=Shouchella rhizosphaerae TaxID=866786 RepID=A0ABZ2CQS9_9BACI